MGILNVTPDSFSDGGLWQKTSAAVDHGRALSAEGADVVDVGGESTRPGAKRPGLDEELARVVPVVEQLAATGTLVSVDTMRAAVARRAVEAGAVCVNDVSGGLSDPSMLTTVASLGVPYICMHWRGHASDMQTRAAYGDVAGDVVRELGARVEAAVSAGISRTRLAVDPGLGFAKTAEHNWSLLGRLETLRALGQPLVVGASRKAFLGALLAAEGEARPPAGRDDATVATSALAAAAGVWCVRVHDVTGSLDAVKVAARWTGGTGP
ncbi:MAG: dihydropteroate synthase [Nocardioidaceae bacterium]